MQSTIKSFAVMTLFMTYSLMVSAQTNRFSISLNSLTTNFNYGEVNNALEDYKKNYKGLQAGFAYQVGITPSFSVVPELYFAMKGGILKEGNPLTVNKSTLRVYSMELPVLARFHFNKLYLNAGPYAAYNLGGRMKTDGSATIQETSIKVAFNSSSKGFERWDLGYQVGAGYNFKMKQSLLTLDVRYGHGLVSISRDVERYNRMLNISIQVSRPGKKRTKQTQG